MTRTPGFRPLVSALESRWLPTIVGPMPLPAQTLLESSYVFQADQATNPVVFLGDSTTYNWGTATRWAPGSPVFSTAFSPLGAANFGIYGNTSENLLGRVLGGDLNGKPKVAVVMIGVNDLASGETPLQAATGVATVVAAIHVESPQTSVLVLGVLPTNIAPLNAEILQLNNYIARIGTLPGNLFENPGTLLMGPNGLAKPGLIFSDNVHPTGSAYFLIEHAIDGTVDQMLANADYVVSRLVPPPLAPSTVQAAASPMVSASLVTTTRPSTVNITTSSAVPTAPTVLYIPPTDSSTGLGASTFLTDDVPTTKPKTHASS